MPQSQIDLALSESLPPPEAEIILNMVVGDMPEPYLEASLDALFDEVDWAIINFNGNPRPDDTAHPNVKVILESRFSQEERLTLLGLHFRNYAFNRNLLLEASRTAKWILRMDADEIPYPGMVRRALRDVPPWATRIFGHFWHFLKGFDKVQNASADPDPAYMIPFLFRMHSDLYWAGTTHERIAGMDHYDWVIPDHLWVHTGYVDPTHVFAKWERFAEIEGRAGMYDNYFRDPKAKWRTGPETILDDRPTLDFPGSLPPRLATQLEYEEETRRVAEAEALEAESEAAVAAEEASRG